MREQYCDNEREVRSQRQAVLSNNWFGLFVAPELTIVFFVLFILYIFYLDGFLRSIKNYNVIFFLIDLFVDFFFR